MDGLVMSDSISKEVHSLDSILYVSSQRSRIGRVRMVRECRRERGHPERREVRRGAEVPPEPEGELGDHLAGGLGLLPARRSPSCGVDVLDGAAPVLAGEELTSPVPDGRPALRRSVGDEGGVHRLADDNPESNVAERQILVPSTIVPHDVAERVAEDRLGQGVSARCRKKCSRNLGSCSRGRTRIRVF